MLFGITNVLVDYMELIREVSGWEPHEKHGWMTEQSSGGVIIAAEDSGGPI